MNAAYPARKSSRAPLLLLGITGLHGLLLLLAPQLHGQRPHAPTQDAAPMLLWLLPTPKPPVAVNPPANTAAPQPIRAPHTIIATHAIKPPTRLAPAPANSPPPASVAASAPQAPAGVTATLPPPGQTGPLSSDTQRDLARIAQEMRKESRFPADFNVHARPDKLAIGIADAYRGDGPTTITDIKRADGSVMTKVSGPGGTYCVYKDSVGHTGGVDQMQRGVMTKVTNCPQ